MKKIVVHKDGWNTAAAIAGPFWYIYRNMPGKGLLMLLICLCSLGIGIIPVWIYCGFQANKDFYQLLKRRNIYIDH
ncbi:hypothetical protein [Petroclostridium sp. X23]|uniref:hypothetical protein n=1 Tax=Petroclostridium sp. X23 TaxID=3045146 RepID=UPI0024ACAB3B|nr:hypothetical protein [Petroclostridium sp. X23]WHH57471.1 hypothetical protein QKW49_16745 [Petroclostridium sp. X23]